MHYNNGIDQPPPQLYDKIANPTSSTATAPSDPVPPHHQSTPPVGSARHSDSPQTSPSPHASKSSHDSSAPRSPHASHATRSRQARPISQTVANPSGDASSTPSPQSDPESPSSQPQVGPQASCTPRGWASMSTPDTSGRVSYVSGRDPNPVQWRVDGNCVLHLTGGTTPYWANYTKIPWYSIALTLAGVSVEGNLTITSPTMFTHCPNVTSFTVQPGAHIHLANQGGMGLFQGCAKLTTLDLSSFDTTNATSTGWMFAFCSGLTTLDLSNLDTTNTTEMGDMFAYSPGLRTLDLSNFNTTNVRGMRGMFYNCSGLTTLDLSNFNTTNTRDMGQMFQNCSGLRRVALGAHTRIPTTSGGDSTYFPGSYPVSTWVKVDALVSDPYAYTPSTPAWTGTTSQLQTQAAGTSPQGVYVDKTLIPTGVKLLADANGGAMPANWSDHVDTNLAAKTLSMPNASITGNKPGSLLAGWNTCKDPASSASCTAYTTSSTIHVAQGDSWPARTIRLYAQWTPLDAPKANTPTVTVPASGDPTISVDITNPSTYYNGEKLYATTHKPETWTNLTNYTASGSGGTTTWTGLAASAFQTSMGDTYTVETYATMTDPATTRTVSAIPSTADGSKLSGILPYAKVSFDANGGSGAPTGTLSGLADSTTNKTQLKIPTSTIPTGKTDPGQSSSHLAFTGWNTTNSATSPDTDYNPGQTITNIGTKTLYAVWKTVAAPTGLTATRLTAGNRIQVTGSSTPWASADTVTVCAKRTGSPETAWKCATTGDTDSQWAASSSAWDGATTHTWTVTIPHDFTIDPIGAYDIKATLNTKGPWNATNTATSLDATASPQIGGTLSSLPLTGGQPQRLATLLAGGLGMTLLLLAAANGLREQRRKHARHSR
ncbi:BspA family leucine-rich repeat surface protein [Bifidobacterium sp. ESL0775]|uniref:BspA family leucine-rich repeat surface protein n=1 Tax=Bifidobacterium sp. ESL0775 TaxID=2983230 RepID=UPI0023F94AAF|nr:BspA family leucine-rich repeat surface protein [Bifidobacterium sp. ESL0775]WEV69649.1 BspA family leucine-rich repeat surface protein [Bifidobacterium sp. ESL0775]